MTPTLPSGGPGGCVERQGPTGAHRADRAGITRGPDAQGVVHDPRDREDPGWSRGPRGPLRLGRRPGHLRPDDPQRWTRPQRPPHPLASGREGDDRRRRDAAEPAYGDWAGDVQRRARRRPSRRGLFGPTSFGQLAPASRARVSGSIRRPRPFVVIPDQPAASRTVAGRRRRDSVFSRLRLWAAAAVADASPRPIPVRMEASPSPDRGSAAGPGRAAPRADPWVDNQCCHRPAGPDAGSTSWSREGFRPLRNPEGRAGDESYRPDAAAGLRRSTFSTGRPA